MCFGCSNEPSHRDGSFMYPQNMFWLRNKKTNLLHSYLGPVIRGVSSSDIGRYKNKGYCVCYALRPKTYLPTHLLHISELVLYTDSIETQLLLGNK